MISMGNSLPSWRRPDEFDPGSDLLRQGFGGGAGAVGDQPFGEALGNDVLDLLPHQFVAAVAELFLRLHVQQDDLSARVHHHHGIGSRFQQPAVLRSRLLAFAEIAADLGKAAQISRRIAQRGAGDIGQKPGAIFPHPHALFFVPAAGGGDGEHFLRAAALDVFRGKETGKIAPDNLFRAVALDALRPGIPTHNPALRVQHENGVVLDSVEQHPVLFFAVPQRLFCLPASGIAALQAPARGCGDQQAQQRSQD